MKNSDAISLFLEKERIQLQGGKRQRNLVILSGIFLLAIVSIGFGSASLRYLKHKMEDRYVTCVDIIVDQVYGNGFESLNDFVQTEEVRSKYGIDGLEKVWQISERFLDVDGRPTQLDGRSCRSDSPILNGTILSKENVIEKSVKSLSDGDVAIIISVDGLKKLQLKEATFVMQNTYLSNDSTASFAIPVFAIVKELPDMCDFLVTEGYLKQEIAEGCDHFDVSLDKYNHQVSFCCSSSMTEAVLSKLGSTPNNVAVSDWLGTWDVDMQKVTLPVYSADYKMAADSIASLVDGLDGVSRVYDFISDTLNISRKPQLYSCFFNRTDLQSHVEGFRNQLKEETGYTLDMGKINNLKNLGYVQAMGNALSISIILLSIFFISIFVFFLLNTHFQKIQKNLGTFKAFGMSNDDLERIYLRVMVEIITKSFGIAAIISMVFTLLLSIVSVIEPGYRWVNVFVWSNLLLFVLTIVVAVLTTKRVSKKLLCNTPGDLIYNRISNQ